MIDPAKVERVLIAGYWYLVENGSFAVRTFDFDSLSYMEAIAGFSFQYATENGTQELRGPLSSIQAVGLSAASPNS